MRYYYSRARNAIAIPVIRLMHMLVMCLTSRCINDINGSKRGRSNDGRYDSMSWNRKVIVAHRHMIICWLSPRQADLASGGT